MSANQRGLIMFVIMVAVTVFFCGILPFTIMPNNGFAMALPVIQVPGEYFIKDWPSPQFELVNTIIGTLIADVLVLLLAFLALRASKGWRNEVPGRFQGMMEGMVEFVYGLVKQMAGTTDKVRNILFPIVASIFFFLLVANWIELIPGVDSVGVMHCAEPGHNAYGRRGVNLYNDQALFSGYVVDNEDQYHACEELLEGHVTVEADYTPEQEAEINALVSVLNDPGGQLDAETRTNIVHDYEELTGFEHPLFFATAEELESGVQPYGFFVTPFVRAAATDLNLTIGLALVSFGVIQYFGVSALGLGYLQKFINVRALGNISKRPLGAVDFLVGLFEIISEFSKVISLAFRLFGNIFAGQLLLFIMAFLIATLLPVIFYGLEFIVGFIQALVFAVLTLVFSAQAMEDHSHHEEEH